MRVLITGATGFVGSHVTRLLLRAGREVAILSSPGNSLFRLGDVARQLTRLEGRLEDREALRPQLADFRPEACLHLAWYAEPGKYLHSPENIPALTNSLWLLEELIRLGCTQVVMAGTCAEYDTNAGYLSEDGPTRPATVYAAAKLALNLVGQQLAAAAGINFAWARLFYLYGPGEDARRLVPALIKALRKGEAFPATAGEQVRDYLHVEDVAAALVTLAARRAQGVFNIASGVPVTVRQLMETVGEIVGRPELIQFGALPYRNWEPMFVCGDNRRLRALDWHMRYTLQEGLRQVAAGWQ